MGSSPPKIQNFSTLMTTPRWMFYNTERWVLIGLSFELSILTNKALRSACGLFSVFLLQLCFAYKGVLLNLVLLEYDLSTDSAEDLKESAKFEVELPVPTNRFQQFTNLSQPHFEFIQVSRMGQWPVLLFGE